MIHGIKTGFIPVLLFSLVFVGSSVGYTDRDVRLFNAAEKGDVKRIEDLTEQGADVNVRLGENRLTPLMAAARRGHLKAVTVLLSRGADPNLKDARFNKNAYHWALKNAHHDIARLLLENGASKELKPPSRFFRRGTSIVVFLVLSFLMAAVWVLYFSSVVPFLKAHGIRPIAFFIQWRLRGELEAYAQLRQAQGKSLTVYHIAKYAYYAIYIVLIFFVISVFKTCQNHTEKTRYETLKGWHDSKLERMLDE